ncbi:MAG TPA: dienelactone hydrolase family protein [Gammaproteobacteria bacterium]
MTRRRASDYSPAVLKLFDQFVHGDISRREFLDRAAGFAVGGVTATALLESLVPDFAAGQRIAEDDPRIDARYVDFASPQGAGTIRGYLVKPAGDAAPRPGVVVIHENRGLNPHIEDIARRIALEGFVALAPDALTPLGGYPGDEDRARELFAQLDRERLVEDFVAAVEWLEDADECNGRVGAVGFCFGGGMVNQLAVRLPGLAAGVAFYGGQPPTADVPKIRAPLLLHYAEMDERINAGWPAYQAALDEAHVEYEAHFYPGTNHGFNNDTTPRFDEEAAALAWERTIAFFHRHLG